MARLEIDRVTKRYGDVYAVRDVTLDVADGEFVVLLGPSGCGKTTTLRVVAGFAEPTSGTVRLGARDITSLPPWKRNAGLVFQSYALFPHLTVAQNVAFGLEMRKVEPAEMSGRVADALRLVRLGASRRAPAAAAVRRPAAAGGAGPRARVPARRAAARRAALQSRCQAAPGGARRDPRAAEEARAHDRHGHPRPGGGPDDGRPAGGHERRRRAPGRHAAGPLRAPDRPLRGRLRGPLDLHRGRDRGARPVPLGGGPGARLQWRR